MNRQEQAMIDVLDLAYAFKRGNSVHAVVSYSRPLSDPTDYIRFHSSLIGICRGNGIRITWDSKQDGIVFGVVTAPEALSRIVSNGRYNVSLIISATYNGLRQENGIAALVGSARFERIIAGMIPAANNPRSHHIGEGKELSPDVKGNAIPLCPVDAKVYTWKTGKDGAGFYLRPDFNNGESTIG